MSIQDFFVQLESGKDRSSLFVTLSRLRRLRDIKDLLYAAAGGDPGDPGDPGASVGGNGWVSWQDMNSGSVVGAVVAGA